MAYSLMQRVVADKKKFSIQLGVPMSALDTVGKPLATGGACAAAGALLASHIVGPATVVKILGVTLYASSGPVGWVVGAAGAAFVAGYSAHVIGRKAKDHFGSTGTYKKEFDGSLSDIGEVVADVVFRPTIALAKTEWNDHRQSYILQSLADWGYAEKWARGFLQRLAESSGDILAPTVEILSQKGFGGRKISDEPITKSHLLGRAMETLGKAAADFGGDRGAVRRREGEIRARLAA